MNITQEQFDLAWNNGKEIRYPSDCILICKVAYDTFGLNLTLYQAQEIWEEHSDSYCAGWLCLDGRSNNEIIGAIESFVSKKIGIK